MKSFKSLIPVIITDEEYLEMNSLSDNEVQRRIKTTVYQSIPEPKCNYVTFRQILPQTLVPDTQLSWLVEQNGPSVVQFATSQLYYRIDWRVANTSSSDLQQRVRYLNVDVRRQVAPEPWDACGKRICILTPKPGEVTTGSFSVPGEYLYFVIEDPGRNLDIQISVTGYFPCLNKWSIYGDNSSDFCVNTKNRSLYAYTNSVAPLGRIRRTYNPQLLPFVNKILTEYYRNAAGPCLLSNSSTLSSITQEEIAIVTVTFNPDTDVSQGSCTRGNCCGRAYIVLSLRVTPGVEWIATSKLTRSQFTLRGGSRYRMDQININGKSVSFSSDTSFAQSACGALAFLLYPIDSEKSPQAFIPQLSNPPPLSSDAGNRISIRLREDPVNVSFTVNAVDRFFVFDSSGSKSDKIPYETRLNSSIWLQKWIIPTFPAYVYTPSSFTATFRLSIIN